MLVPGGRLLVVDFAPHEMEFLRDEHAHRRLGFASEQMVGWIEAAGLEAVLERRLEPPVGGERGQLTVGLWLARDRRRLVARDET